MFMLKEVTVDGTKRYTPFNDLDEFSERMKSSENDFEILPEFANFMIEVIPKSPFKEFLNPLEVLRHFSNFENAIKNEKEAIIIQGSTTLASMGSQDFYVNPEGKVSQPLKNPEINFYSQSETFSDSLITNHSRFKSFTQNT